MQLPQIEIAVVFDFDITVTPSYMQRPIFDKYGINEKYTDMMMSMHI